MGGLRFPLPAPRMSPWLSLYTVASFRLLGLAQMCWTLHYRFLASGHFSYLSFVGYKREWMGMEPSGRALA